MAKLDHIEQIKNKVEVLQRSSRIHALILEGPAGWGKTTAVDEALNLAGLKGLHVGSYSTPLNLFRHLSENASRISILDDVAGLFSDRAAMAILKASTWPSPAGRIVGWGSTTSRIEVQEFTFSGKLVIICNSFPQTADAKAVKSRSLTHFFAVTAPLAKAFLGEAAKEGRWFKNRTLARKVAEFLCDRITATNLEQFSYRTLHLGYDLAEHKPDNWRELLLSMIQITEADPHTVVRDLAAKGAKVFDQVEEFERITGKKRRTFFKIRKELGVGLR